MTNTKQKVINLLIKYGNNEHDVKKMVDSNYDVVIEMMSCATPSKIAEAVSCLR